VAGLSTAAAEHPDKTAVIGRGRRLSFAEFEQRARALAGFMAAAGLRRRDRVALLCGNRIELLEVASAALRTGIVPVPIHHLLTPPEVSYVIEDSGARLLFTDRAFEHPALEQIVTFGDAYERVLHSAEPAALAPFALGRPMHYTSGTTGRPKGVWVEPYDDALAARRSESFRTRWGIDDADVHLVCSPLSHSAPHRFALRTLEAGGTVVLQGRFDPRETLGSIDFFGVTSVFMAPTHLERIFALDRTTLMRHDVSSLRLLAHAGAPIREVTKRRAIAFFPEGSVWEFYGSTEGRATRISGAEWLRKPGSVGTPEPGVQIRICSPEGEPLPAGEVGQVWIADPEADRFSYWGDPVKTEQAWRDDAFTVGDLGWLDDDGYLFLSGRIDDTIISGGVNVHPQEIESVLAQHPAVAEVVVYGEPHPEWGRQVCAAVVPAYGAPIDPEALRRWARARLAGFKCPRRIVVVESLERTPTGKPLRRPPRA
jgi:acyl-CoA synthetase (AMP-forming)/AMP-acid ligase II